MARPMKPLVRGGGYYPSSRWTPLVYPGGYTTANGNGAEPTPLIKTVKGAIAHVTDALAMPAIGLKCEINPLQAGTGDPSPTNVRPISGWTGCNIHVSRAMSGGTVYPITFPDSAGTVYGGTLDVVNKKLTVNFWGHVFTGEESVSAVQSSTPNFLVRYAGAPRTLSSAGQICSHFPNTNITTTNTNQGYSVTSGTERMQFRFASLFTTVDEFKSWCAAQYQNGTPLVAVAKLQTPFEYNITGISDIRTMYGTNNIWHDANGDTELTYYAE